MDNSGKIINTQVFINLLLTTDHKCRQSNTCLMQYIRELRFLATLEDMPMPQSWLRFRISEVA